MIFADDEKASEVKKCSYSFHLTVLYTMHTIKFQNLD